MPEINTRTYIRWMIRRDMPEVIAIEAASFEHPWTEKKFCTALEQRNVIGMVAEHGEAVVGYMVYELDRTEICVLDFAVRADFRRSGIGRQLIAKMKGKLMHNRRSRLSFVVRESNLDCCLFLKAQGFTATQILRGYFEDSGEDGYAMDFDISKD
jgi:ribosomal-protein-alanine N-acetyltransferase